MKKIILLFVIFLGLTFTAQAQQTNTESYAAAKAEIGRFLNYFELSSEKIDELMPILVKKHETILNSTGDNVKKNEIRVRFATLVIDMLDENVAAKLEGNKELYNEVFGVEY
jgi:hypothetical protein